MAQELIVRQLTQKKDPILYSQTLHLRNELLRIPIGLDLFQEDLSQEEHQVTLAATIRTGLAKSNDNNYNSTPSPNSKDIRENPEEKPEAGSQETQETEEKVVGCIILARVEGDGKTFKIRQMAVSPDLQGQGVGSKLVESAEDFAMKEGKMRLHLHGRKHAVGFYEKHGFRKISEEFLELGIPHYALEKMLSC